MEAENAAKRMAVPSRPLGDPTSALDTAAESDARCPDATKVHSHLPNFASSTEGGRSASTMVARRSPEEGLCIVLR